MAVFDTRRTLIRRDAETRVRAGSRVLQQQLRKNAKRDSGNMAAATTVAASGLVARVRVAVDYASHTNKDTPPHEIVARGGALRFFWPKVGPPQPRFYKRVQHPGTSNVTDWYGNTLDEWTAILNQQRVT